jgi:tetratricopeptide (TPR) repeat protein
MHKNANHLFVEGQYELANEIYSQLINIQYKPDIMYSNKAACFLKLKNYKYALEHALKSIEINLNNCNAWGRVGSAYKGLKMFSESLNAFEIAHKLNKNNENYIKELIFLHQRFNDKITINNVFNLLLNNKNIFNKLKNVKNEITNGLNNDNTNSLFSNNTNSLFSDILNNL